MSRRTPSSAPRASPLAGTPIDPVEAAPLLLGAPGQVLERLLGADPLGLRERAARRLEARCWLLDVDRLVARLAATCALEAPHWRGDPPLEVWLDARVDEAVAGLSAEPDDPARPAGPPWSIFAAPLGLDGQRLRRACGRFDGLPFEVREAFFRLVLDGDGPDAFARERGLSLTEAARRARQALEVLRVALGRSEEGTP